MSRRVRGGLIAGGVLLVVAAAGVAAAGLGGGGNAAAAKRDDEPPATATVTRQTLTSTETVDGTLGYGDRVTLSAHAGNAAMVTWVPADGTTIGRGKPVYQAGDRPVVLLYGGIPIYRTLRPGVSGPDVTVLERNLAALGYDGFTADDEYTSATADAVDEWQDDLGLPETGVVQPDQVVVASGAIRVAETKLHAGDLATGPVLSWTGTTRIVTVPLDAAKQQLVHKGVAATVELPDGKDVPGTVDRVGTVATAKTGQQDTTATVDVTVSLRDQKSLGTLDEAPVSVILQSDKRANVLTVPINALVALAEGGYGVQAVDGDGTRYVAVQTGMFAGGRVEISGDGVTEGMTVGVPR